MKTNTNYGLISTTPAFENDKLRSYLPQPPPHPHQLIFSSQISALNLQKQIQLLEKIKNFNEFNDENDPYNQHDFGSLVFEKNVVVWKIDSLKNNQILCLTVMFEDEY